MSGCDPAFFSRLRQDVKVLENVCFILNKTNRDGFLRRLHDTLNDLLVHELRFAMRELLAYDGSIPSAEVKRQLVNNTFIFKENLKTISACLSKLISRRHLEGKGEGRRAGGAGGRGDEGSSGTSCLH